MGGWCLLDVSRAGNARRYLGVTTTSSPQPGDEPNQLQVGHASATQPQHNRSSPHRNRGSATTPDAVQTGVMLKHNLRAL